MKLNQFAIAIAIAIFSLTIKAATTCCCSSSSTSKTIIMEIHFDQFEIRCFGWTSIVMTWMETYPFLESIFSHVWSAEKWSQISKLHIICIFRNPIVKSKITGLLKGRKYWRIHCYVVFFFCCCRHHRRCYYCCHISSILSHHTQSKFGNRSSLKWNDFDAKTGTH